MDGSRSQTGSREDEWRRVLEDVFPSADCTCDYWVECNTGITDCVIKKSYSALIKKQVIQMNCGRAGLTARLHGDAMHRPGRLLGFVDCVIAMGSVLTASSTDAVKMQERFSPKHRISDAMEATSAR